MTRSSTGSATDRAVGTFRPKTIGDYAGKKLDICIRCRGCGRQVVYTVADVLAAYVARNWPTSVPLDTSHFACRCGSLDSVAEPIDMIFRPQPLPERKPALRPIYVFDPGRSTPKKRS
jgi:hypothetical protein